MKGILKKGRSERGQQNETDENMEEALVCNVPEHHDLVTIQRLYVLLCHAFRLNSFEYISYRLNHDF